MLAGLRCALAFLMTTFSTMYSIEKCTALSVASRLAVEGVPIQSSALLCPAPHKANHIKYVMGSESPQKGKHTGYE